MPIDTAALLLILARLLAGGAFVITGLRNTRAFGALEPMMAGSAMPFPWLSLRVGVGLQIVCGLMMAIGFWPAWAAAGLVLFVVTATLLFHNFWAFEGEAKGQHLQAFLGNVMLTGGLLGLLAASL
jgi:putative oxidoreductase